MWKKIECSFFKYILQTNLIYVVPCVTYEKKKLLVSFKHKSDHYYSCMDYVSLIRHDKFNNIKN